LLALDRLALAEAMTSAEYGAAIAVRQRNREAYARIAARYDAAMTLSALAATPVGLGSTGNPVFNVPASMLGIPAVSLPLLSIDHALRVAHPVPVAGAGRGWSAPMNS
jgi:Asp-tRNA(Asn)/Glu-tRNA(Gln) amidotransferase A subunit family amidase